MLINTNVYDFLVEYCTKYNGDGICVTYKCLADVSWSIELEDVLWWKFFGLGNFLYPINRLCH